MSGWVYSFVKSICEIDDFVVRLAFRSVGCILAELLRKKPFLPGKDELDQLQLIWQKLGSPTEARWPGWSRLPFFNEDAQRQKSKGENGQAKAGPAKAAAAPDTTTPCLRLPKLQPRNRHF